MAAFIMLIGAAIGAQIGTVATKYVKGYGIRIFLGWRWSAAVSVLMKMVASHKAWKPALDPAASILILGLVTSSRSSSSQIRDRSRRNSPPRRNIRSGSYRSTL